MHSNTQESKQRATQQMITVRSSANLTKPNQTPILVQSMLWAVIKLRAQQRQADFVSATPSLQTQHRKRCVHAFSQTRDTGKGLLEAGLMSALPSETSGGPGQVPPAMQSSGDRKAHAWGIDRGGTCARQPSHCKRHNSHCSGDVRRMSEQTHAKAIWPTLCTCSVAVRPFHCQSVMWAALTGKLLWRRGALSSYASCVLRLC